MVNTVGECQAGRISGTGGTVSAAPVRCLAGLRAMNAKHDDLVGNVVLETALVALGASRFTLSDQ